MVPEEMIRNLGGRVLYVPPYGHPKKFTAALRKIFKENNYLIVHSHINTLSVLSLYAAKKEKVPVRIAHAHSTAGSGEIVKNFLKEGLRGLSNIYPTNRFACSEHAGKWMFGEREFTVLRNAVDLRSFLFDSKVRESTRKELGIAPGSFVIGQVGRLCYQKNQRFSIELLSRLVNKLPNAELVLVGDGEDKHDLKQLVDELNLDGSVHFVGHRHDIGSIYQAFDLFIMPSKYEGFGTVAIEAQASGLPCLFSTHVPQETELTRDVHFLPLNEDYSRWIECILDFAGTGDASRIVNIADFSEYDITQKARELQELYESMYSRHTSDCSFGGSDED